MYVYSGGMPLAKENRDSVLMASGGRGGRLSSRLLQGTETLPEGKKLLSPDAVFTGILCHSPMQGQDSEEWSLVLVLNSEPLIGVAAISQMNLLSSLHHPLLPGFVCFPVPLPRQFQSRRSHGSLHASRSLQCRMQSSSDLPSLDPKDREGGGSCPRPSRGRMGWQVQRK